MSNRYNETNSSGFVTLNSNTVIGVDNYTDQYSQVPLAQQVNQPGVSFYPVITVTANGHAVERDGDMGLWDTVSGVAVRTDQCTFGPGLNANYPNT
jgi:hypothetical protein